ncbi:lipoprotein 17-related variable surface protein [Mycoplasmopsis pulmonis]|uniref:lipoprotein 17-related variable surface protein n=1 Tax=Mycoplasmopsis pulmonis TaxID=2107 RepID=UPI00100508C2|nr:lipoprotein 17-related variable surface protein [Mycoplasmopsis pulmonis]VEU67804.1 Lipoprotein associated domain [Mycoplasmopsis pulmonis]
MKLKKILISFLAFNAIATLGVVGGFSYILIQRKLKNKDGKILDLLENITKIKSLKIKETSYLKRMLPSKVTSSTSINESDLILEDQGTKYNLRKNYKISLKPASGDAKANDLEGTLDLMMFVSENNSSKPSASQKIRLSGFQTLLESLEETQVNLIVKNKEQILASDLKNKSANDISEGLSWTTTRGDFDSSKYLATYSVLWANDEQQKARIKLTLTLKHKEIKRDFSFLVEGFKKPEITEQITSVQLKNPGSLSVREVKENILKANKDKSSAQEKLETFKEYFDLEVPENLTFNFVSLESKSSLQSTGILKYTFSKENQDNASDQEPNSKNGKLVSNINSLEITGFKLPANEIEEELLKISKVVEINSTLKSKKPSQITQSILDIFSDFQPIDEEGQEYKIDPKFSIKYKMVESPEIDDKDGSLKINLILESSTNSATKGEKNIRLYGLAKEENKSI